MQTFGDYIEALRGTHYPKGNADIVLVRPGGSGFVQCNSAEITACIDEIERMGTMGEPASPLQKLAIRLLSGWLPDDSRPVSVR